MISIKFFNVFLCYSWNFMAIEYSCIKSDKDSMCMQALFSILQSMS